MSTHQSVHLGTKIDNFDNRITALETTTTTHTNQITNIINNKLNTTNNNTMTDSLITYDSPFGMVPANNYWGRGYYIYDSSKDSGCYIRAVSLTDGYTCTQMETYRTVNGTALYHGIRLEINATGTKRVTVNNQVAWRKGLGLPKILHGSIGLSNGQATLTFSSAFGSAPTVITSAQGTGTLDYSTHPGSVTAGGCKIFGTQESGSGAVEQGTYSSVHWIAIGTDP